MRPDSILLEEKRLSGIESQDQYQSLHERHRIFPAIFENRGHKRILDISAGVGIVGKRIKDYYPDAEMICNDVSETALKTMQKAGLQTVSFDIDLDNGKYPLPDCSFDAVISLATIEHIIHIDNFIKEIYRILSPEGHLYISTPNYAGLLYLLPVLLTGRTFHNPQNDESRYEFYGHVRYFTYTTLLEYITPFGFEAQATYLGVPKTSSKFIKMQKKSPLKALAFKSFLTMLYKCYSPRWASEPVVCLKKTEMLKQRVKRNIKKVVL